MNNECSEARIAFLRVTASPGASRPVKLWFDLVCKLS